MKIVHLRYPNVISDMKESVVALGFFDGVHRGHQEVIKGARELANEQNALHSLMTFHPHPKEVLGKVEGERYLTPFAEKRAIFERLGIELLFIMQFDQAFSKLTPQQFVQEVLLPLRVKGVVTGFNFHFGQGGKGSGQDLAQLGQSLFETRIVPPILEDQLPISSTRVREALSSGDIERVSRFLGRTYAISGRVIHGDQRGRVIGFPTANIEPHHQYWIPKRGVYVIQAHTDAGNHFGMMNIGIRPTFDHPVPREVVEVHLFQFAGDLYDQEVTVEILHHLRPERKFSSVDQLIKQLKEDQKSAEQWISEVSSL